MPHTKHPFEFLDSRFGKPVRVWPEVKRYGNHNLAIQLFSFDEDNGFIEPWATATVNLNRPYPDWQVAIKTWSENDGLAKLLVEAKILKPEVLMRIPCGEHGAMAEVYILTDEFLKEMVK